MKTASREATSSEPQAGRPYLQLSAIDHDKAELMVEMLRKDFPAALADLRRSLNFDPRNYGAMNDLGAALEQIGAKKDALEAYRKALKANPFLDEARDAVKELTREVEGQDI